MFDLNEQEQKKFNKIFMNNLIIDNMFPSNRTPLGNNWLLDNAIFSYIWAKGSSKKRQLTQEEIEAREQRKQEDELLKQERIANIKRNYQEGCEESGKVCRSMVEPILNSKNPLLFPLKAFLLVIGGGVLFTLEKMGLIEKAE